MKRLMTWFIVFLLVMLAGKLTLAADYQAELGVISGGAVVEDNYVKITGSGGKIMFSGLPPTSTMITVYYKTSSNAGVNINFNGQYNATVSNSVTDTSKPDPKGSYSKTSYYISINTINNGETIWIDKISDGQGGGGDTTKPTATLTVPTAGATISGSTIISATASDNVGVTKVGFYVGNALITEDTTAPYSVIWDASSVPNGSYHLTVKAYDTAGNEGVSSAVNVLVQNQTTDITPPTTNITEPGANTTLAGTCIVNANAYDNVGVIKVGFYYGTTLISEDTSAPYSITWNTTAVADGSYSLTAKAYDAAGNVGTSTAVNVRVDNNLTGLTVHFKRPNNWGASVRIHYWNMNPSSVPISGAWPGIIMTNEGNDWYTITVNGTTGMSMVFNDGNGNQTTDLSRSASEGWYYTDNKWYDQNPEAPKIPVISCSPAPGTYLNVQSVILSSTDASDKIYYTTDGTTPTVASSLYNGPIHVASSMTIKAFGVNVSNQAGTIASFSYTINPNADLEKPTITAFPATGRYDSAILAAFTIRDNKATTTTAYYTTDGTQPTTSSPIYTYGNASAGLAGPSLNITGNVTINFLVVDGADNQTRSSFSYAIGKLARNDFREESIYFLMTSRFYDGDLSNNVHCWDDGQAKNPDSDPAWRGDFKGLIQKLDYIKALGFSAVWITPVVANASGYDYHGYHAVNFKKVDPRYESTGVTYQDLVNAAHARGMKIIQDIVINHTSNFGEENLFPMFKKDPTKPDTPDNLLKITDKLPSNYDSLTPGLQYGSRIDLMKDASRNNNIYHTEKSLSWESYTVQTGQIAGDCVDLNTEDPHVIDYLIDAYNYYIDLGVDGFRIDTVKHVSRYIFNKYFMPAWMERGGEDFYMFGEVCTRYRDVWNSGIPAISSPFYTWKESKSYPGDGKHDYLSNKVSVEQNWADNTSTAGQPVSDNHLLIGNNYHTPDWSKRSHMDVIDFPMHWAFSNAQDAFRMNSGDKYYNDATWNVLYVDSHDYAPDQAPENQRFAGSQDTWAENLDLIFTFRGIPCIFYGSEIEFQKGKPIDVGPNAPLSETGRAYFGDHLEGNVTVTDFGKYSNASGAMATTLNHPLAQHIRRLNLLRRAVPALQKGQYSLENISTNSMAFKKRYTNAAEGIDSYALVVISGSATFTDIINGTYTDAITGDTQIVNNGTLTISCTGKGNMRVYILNGSGKIGEDGLYLK